MNAEHRARFEAQLIAWKSEILAESERTISHLKDEAYKPPI